MWRRLVSCLAAALVVAAGAALLVPVAPARGKQAARKLLYPDDPKKVPAALAPAVEKLLTGKGPSVAPETIQANGVYLRVVPVHHVLKNGQLKPGGWLGPRPFVFLTLPETAYGRGLLELYGALGYGPNDVLANTWDVEQVAILYRYPDGFTLHKRRDGCLPPDWKRGVYPSTWSNLFALAEQLVADKEAVVVQAQGGFVADRTVLRSEKEAAFVIGFPAAGKQRVRTTPYRKLSRVGGADWEYRALVERLTGATEHFKGDGTTLVTFGPVARTGKGFPEFLGPNVRLDKISDLAVIGLGSLAGAD